MSSWDEVDGRLRRRVTLEWGGGLSLVLSNVEAFEDEYQGWMEELTGWYGGVDVSGTDTQRVLGHGLFPEPSLRTGRVLTLSGVLQLASERDRTVAERFVSGILGDGGFGTLTYEVEAAPTLSAQVKLDGAVKTTPHGLDLVRFEAPLLAPDPFLVGEEQVARIYPPGRGVGLVWPMFTAPTPAADQAPVTGSADPEATGGDPDAPPEGVPAVSAVQQDPVDLTAPSAIAWGAADPNTIAVVHNRGNAPSSPVIRVWGEFPSGFILTADTGETITCPWLVTQSAPVTVDYGTGLILQGGVDQSWRATRRDWLQIPPGETRAWRIRAIQPGEGWAEVHHRDTYI